MKLTTINLTLLLIVGLLIITPIVQAQQGFQIVQCGKLEKDASGKYVRDPTTGDFKGQCTYANLKFLVIRMINYLTAWAWLISVVFVLWAGYNMLQSGGNAEKVQTAKTTLNNAVLGFFFVSIAYILINWLTSILTGLPLKEMIKFLP